MDACTPTSRTSLSLVMIDSISVNIDAVELNKSEKCEHFTIRGFVSDTRVTNGTHCWPVSVDGSDASSKDDTDSRPYMDVEKFRQWQCQSCLSEIEAQGTLEDAVNTTVSCSRVLKTKNYHRSLEDVLAHLLKKSEKHPKLGCTQCKPTKSALEFSQKQPVDLGKLNMKGLGENELNGAASDFDRKRRLGKNSNSELVTSADVNKHQERWLVSGPTTSIKVGKADGTKHSRRHVAGMKLAQNHQNNDDSGSAGHRKTKKVRLLNDLFDKDSKGDQPAVTRVINANKASYSALGQKRKTNSQEEDNQHSQMQNAGGSEGKEAMIKHQVLNSRSADESAMHVTSNNESSAVSNQAQKMISGSNQGADVQKHSYNRGQKRNIDLCKKRPSLSTCQPFQGEISNSSQFKGKSISTFDKVHQDVATPVDKSKEIYRNNESKNAPMDEVQIGHQAQYVQDDQSGKSHYHFSDGCLDPRQNTRHCVPHTENRNFLNGFTMKDPGESKDLCKSLVDKNMWQKTNSISSPKRPIHGPYTGNKKKKYSAATMGLTVVHQTELLFSTSNRRVLETQESPEHSESMMQEVGTSDDIPMEIVELMAKNQYERRLYEEGDNYHHPRTVSKTKHAVGSTRELSNEGSAKARNPKSHLPSTLPNARVISEIGSGISNKRHDGSMMQRYISSAYCPVLSSNRDLSTGFQPPSLGPIKPDLFQKCNYNMNAFPPQHGASPKSRALYEKCQPASGQSDKAAQAWLMKPPNPSVHMLDAFQGNGLHLDVGKVPTCSSYVVEGRSLCNFSLPGYGPTTDSFRPEASNAHLPYRLDSRPQMRMPPDPYSNETVTAMHLLSLMDDGMQSSKVTNTEAGSRKTFERSISNDHLSKELSLNNLGLGYQNKGSHSKASYKCSPHTPWVGSVVTSVPADARNEKGQERTYMNRNYGGSLLGDAKNYLKSQKSQLACGSGVKGELIPAYELSKPTSGPMWSGSGSSYPCMNGNISAYSSLMPSQSYEKVKRLAEHGACYVNRNPMDFTTPGPGNEYMIGTEELKFRNEIYHPFITTPAAINTFKQNGVSSYTPLCNKL